MRTNKNFCKLQLLLTRGGVVKHPIAKIGCFLAHFFQNTSTPNWWNKLGTFVCDQNLPTSPITKFLKTTPKGRHMNVYHHMVSNPPPPGFKQPSFMHCISSAWSTNLFSDNFTFSWYTNLLMPHVCVPNTWYALISLQVDLKNRSGSLDVVEKTKTVPSDVGKWSWLLQCLRTPSASPKESSKLSIVINTHHAFETHLFTTTRSVADLRVSSVSSCWQGLPFLRAPPKKKRERERKRKSCKQLGQRAPLA